MLAPRNAVDSWWFFVTEPNEKGDAPHTELPGAETIAFPPPDDGTSQAREPDERVAFTSAAGSLEDLTDLRIVERTGKELWRALNDPEIGYAPPMIYEFGGLRQLIIYSPLGIAALNPATGDKYWDVEWHSNAGLSVVTPRKLGNRLFVTSFYNGPLMIEVSNDSRSAEVAWKGSSDSEIDTDGLHSIMPTPWVTEDAIFGICSYGQLRCLDTRIGERIWETFEATGKDRWWNAFLIPHEDRFFIHNEQGELIIANLSRGGYQEVDRAKLIEPTRPVRRRQTIWSHPAFAMKSVFARNDKELVRVSLAKD